MFGVLYRYPHPYDATKFIYCGQGSNRDRRHRSGATSFGRRFLKRFPNTQLSQPLIEIVEVQDQLELNELETIWMFRFHTWRGYLGGMNLTLPGSQDYKNMGKIGGRIGAAFLALYRTPEHQRRACAAANRKHIESGHSQRLGQIQGLRNVESGHMQALGRAVTADTEHQRRAGTGGGRKAVESGHLLRIASLGGQASGRKNVESGHLARLRTTEHQRKASRIANCLRWNIRRGKFCVCGKHI